jgi:DNA repair exonuclease SbcCD ATPase subunit
MILHTVHISGWRCFLNSVAVGPFTDGLNVIHAPNGTGKSTLFEAIRRGLLDSHGVGGLDIQAVRPWGRDLSPKVTIEFSQGDTRYRVTKQFLEGAFSKLERLENGRFTPLAESRGADERVRTMLTRNPPGRGLSQSRHWGWAQVLWAPQGRLLLNELSEDIVADIRDALGSQLSDPASNPLEKKITDLYEQYFTRQGKLKSGRHAPEIIGWKKDLEETLARRQQLREDLQRFEETSRLVEDLRGRHAQMNLEAAALAESIQDLRDRADDYRRIKTELEKHAERRAAAESEYKDRKRHLDQIRDRQKELDESRGKLADLEETLQARRRELIQRESDLHTARKAREDSRTGEQAVQSAEKEAADALDYERSLHERNRVAERVNQVKNVAARMAEDQRARAKIIAPDAGMLKQIRSLIQQRDRAALRVEASLISLEIVSETDAEATLIAGENTGECRLTSGKSARFKGSPEVVLDVKNLARIRASGPTGDIEAQRRKYRRAAAQIESLTRPYGVDDLGALETLADTAAELEQRVRESGKTLETLLEGWTREALEQRLAELEAVLASFHRKHPDWQAAPPDGKLLTRAAEELRSEHLQKVAAADAAWEKAQTAHAVAVEHEKALVARIEDARKHCNRVKEKLGDLTADGQSPDTLENALNQILMRWEAVRVTCSELESKLESFADDPRAALEKLEQRVHSVREAAHKARDDEMVAVGQLETLAAKGPYSALTQVEEALSDLSARIQAEELRQSAVKLLYDTLDECRREAITAVAGPVARNAGILLKRIAGRRTGRIEIDASFIPKGVTPEMVESPVALENLSGGEQEQLYLATRLALAEVLAGDERQMVVLDDVLAATDAGRLARVMSVLEEAGRRLQILILTCQPERYGGLTGASRVDLEAILRDSR